MEFLKKHYEKILLGLVLAGLVGALVVMPFYISADNRAMTDLIETIIKKPVTKLPDLDLSAQSAVTARLSAPFQLDLDSTNRVFNPMQWQQAPDGSLIPTATQVGPQMVIVTNITPLYLILTLDSVNTNESVARYEVGVEKQAEKMPAKRHKVPRFVSVGDKPNETFSLVDVRGAPENPDALDLKLVDTGEVVSISLEKGYRRVDAYSADFHYDLEKKSFRNRREGDVVAFNGTDYLVAGVTQDGIVLQDQSNQKKTARPFTP